MSFGSRSHLGVAIFSLQKVVYSWYLCACDTVHKWYAIRQLSLAVLTLTSKSLFHRSMNFSLRSRIYSIEKIFQVSLVGIIRKVDKLFKLLLESVSQKSIMYPSNSRYIDANDSEKLHLLWIKPASDEINT